MKNEMALNQISPAAPNCARTRWMVVDDNDGVLELIACIITTISGDRVSCFRSGAEALEAFAAAPERFQFVITDLEMPGMSGIELCRKLLALSPRVKSLLVTGSGIITREEARRFGFCDLLSKPFAPSALRQVLEAAGVLNPNSKIGMGSARVARASSGVAPELLSHTIPGISGAKKFAGRCFRRDAENHTPEACAPPNAPAHPAPTSEFVLNNDHATNKTGWRPDHSSERAAVCVAA